MGGGRDASSRHPPVPFGPVVGIVAADTLGRTDRADAAEEEEPMAGTRPGGVTLVAVLTWISGAINIIAGVFGLFPGGTDFWYAVGLIILGLVIAAVASGLLRGSRLSRTLVTIVQVISLISGVFAIVNGPLWSGLGTVLIAIIVLVILWSRRANEFFQG
jgi:protein-S-isoprenylcysteine O-methyltransferase Ste14